MTVRIGLGIIVGLLSGIGVAAGQGVPPSQPDQPVAPQNPTLQANPAGNPAGMPQQLPAPFTLTPREETQLDRSLKAWEQGTQNVKSFQCTFKRMEYNPTLPGADPNKPRTEDAGELRYGAPDKGMFHVDGKQPEKWICDGRSIFEYDYANKRIIEHKLPPELSGKAITDGPLPFLFGSSAEKLRKRYYLKDITPIEHSTDQIWIQAWPRFQTDAANFSCAELIVRMTDKMPVALRQYSPNKIDNVVYVFEKPVINNPFSFLQGDPFKPTPPSLGWTKVVEDVSSPHVPGK